MYLYFQFERHTQYFVLKCCCDFFFFLFSFSFLQAVEVNKYSSNKLFAEFGLKFESSLASIRGRTLKAPQVPNNVFVKL